MIRKTVALLGFCGLALGACATPTIVNPSWAELPSPDEMGDAAPGFAGWVGLEGFAILACTGLPDGRLANCDVLQESPDGVGYGDAALQLAPRFLLSPRTVDGEASKGRVRFSIRFRTPENEPAPPYEGPEPDDSEVALALPLAEKLMEFERAADDVLELDVDEDRLETVERIIAEADAEFEREQSGTLALALARVLTPSQIQGMIERRPPAEPLPPIEDLYAAGAAEGMAIEDRLIARVKEKYCALYSCELKPSRPVGPGASPAYVQPGT